MIGSVSDSVLRAGALGTMLNASTYGRTIPLIYGTSRAGLLAIWAGNLRSGSSGGGSGKGGGKKSGKGSATTYQENIDFLVAHNPILYALQAWDTNNTYYPLAPKKYTASSGQSITIPDDNFYCVLAVTITQSYSETFDDYGGQGPQTFSGTYERPLWNAAFNGPDPCSTQAYLFWPYIYWWMPGAGAVVSLPQINDAEISGEINIYYAAVAPGVYAYSKANTGAKSSTEIPIAALNLEFETMLGEGDEYSLADESGDQIIYPWFAGIMSPNINLGASGNIPNINIEFLGSFALYSDPLLDTMGGDADFADMIQDIFTSGPAQGGYTAPPPVAGALGLTAVRHGLNCCDFPGIVQKKLWSVSNFEDSPTLIPFDAQVTIGSFLLVMYRSDTNGPPTGISDSMGNAWTLRLANVGSGYQYCWTAQAKATGPTAVTVAETGSYHQQLDMYEVAGYDTMESIVTAHGSASVPSLSITSTTQRARQALMFAWWDFAQAGYNQNAAARWTAVTGLQVNPISPEYGVMSEQQKVWAPQTLTITHPLSSQNWVGIGFAFKSAAVPLYPVSLGAILEPTTLANAKLGARAGGLWGSLYMSSARRASDVLKDLYASMNAAPVWSGFQLKSIAWSEVSAVANGAVFVAPTAGGPIANLGPSDFVGDADTPPGSIVRKAEIDAPPILSMQVFDRSNSYYQTLIAVPDPVGAALFGTRKADPMKRDEIRSPSVAETLLQIATRCQIYIRNNYKYKVKFRAGALLEPMDLVTITDPQVGLLNFPVRVTNVQEDDKHNLDFEFEPFVYGMHAPQALTATGNSPYQQPYGADPGSVNAPIFIEAVPALALAPNTESLLIVVSGSGPDYGGSAVWVSTDGGDTYQTGEAWTIPSNGITGYTVGDWPAHADPDAANDLSVDLSESNGDLSAYTPEQRDALLSLFYVDGGSADIPYEIDAYNAVELTGSSVFMLEATGSGNEIRRAVYNAPTAGEGVDHPNGSRFAFLGSPLGLGPGVLEIPIQPSWVGVALKFKFQAFNTLKGGLQSLADVTPYTFTPTGIPGSVNPMGLPPSTANFADAETPSGAIDGSNVTFFLVYAPNPPASLILVLNGVVQHEGADADYVLNDNIITMAAAPQSAIQPPDYLLAWYRW